MGPKGHMALFQNEVYLLRGVIEVIKGLYRDNGKENGN